MKTHTHYERSQSPWNRKMLVWLWCLQTIGSIIVTVFAAALHDRREGLVQLYDDGISDSLFVLTSYLVFSFTVMNAILMIPTYFHYKKNSLSPKWMMIGSVWMALFWLSVIAMSMGVLVCSSPTFEVYQALMLLNIVAALPYFRSLFYYSGVYGSWKKARKVDVETTNERYSLDSRKQLADEQAMRKE
ncbi:hypothetical protein BKA65DRAFT_513829 [Rhexocercosporidium sp. MPI-PUGE-AT-0058]|nr:hypothetical protein BKA65DRAFT_513829 [Rhexocercosporidium sp. MPI-PUGE-AT-0058]